MRVTVRDWVRVSVRVRDRVRVDLLCPHLVCQCAFFYASTPSVQPHATLHQRSLVFQRLFCYVLLPLSLLVDGLG